jgi:hypothetical protein
MSSLTRRNLAYWATTILVALIFTASAALYLSGAPGAADTLRRLGYPGYFATVLAVWKGLAAVALVVPRFERLKEWAYAGLFFDLTGAAVSHAAMGDALGPTMIPLVILGLVLASWALRPESRRLSAARPEARGKPLTSDGVLARS